MHKESIIKQNNQKHEIELVNCLKQKEVAIRLQGTMYDGWNMCVHTGRTEFHTSQDSI